MFDQQDQQESTHVHSLNPHHRTQKATRNIGSVNERGLGGTVVKEEKRGAENVADIGTLLGDGRR